VNFDLYDKSECRRLLKLIREGSCVVFVGSGLSTGIYPSWEALIHELCEKCGIEGINGVHVPDAEILFAKADEAKSKDPITYKRTLKKIFAPVVHKREAHELLMRLTFKFYITTNFDPLLANETNKPEYRCKGVYRYPDLRYRESRAVYHIHGMVMDDPQHELKIILGGKDFEEGYSNNKTLHSFLHQVLTYESMLFVGCRLSEPPLRDIFKLCRETRNEIEAFHSVKAPDRYILLPYQFNLKKRDSRILRDKEVEDEENSRFDELGVKTIRYFQKDSNHSGLEEIFREWCQIPPINVLKGFDFGDL